MSEPHSNLDPEILRAFLAGRLPEPESRPIEAMLARDEILPGTLLALDVRDPLTDALRATPSDLEMGGEEEPVVAQLVQQLRALHRSRAADTRPRDSMPTTASDGIAYPFLRPAESPGEMGRLGPYRVLGELGRGGMGIVFRAEELRLERLVALKVIRPQRAADPSVRRRFLREARAAAALSHDHVVPIYRADEDGDVLYLAMPLLTGESLAQRLQREGRLTTSVVLRVGREVASALAAAHGRGLIHRDIKPGNLFLEAPSGRVKLLDFGLARTLDGDSETTCSGGFAGTPAYMAPEQVRGRAEPRSDLFSLGCVLYRAAAGAPPFAGEDTLEVLANLANHDPPPLHEVQADVPAALSSLIEMLLAKEPEGRPASAEQVVAAIGTIEADIAAQSAAAAAQSDVGAATAAGQAPRRHRWLFGLLLAGLGAAALCGWIVRVRQPDGQIREWRVPAGSTVELIPGPEAAVTPPAEWIVDDGDAGYAETGPGWQSGGLAGGFQGDYRYNGPGAQTARWTVSSLAPGDYEVFLIWLAHPNRAYHVPLAVYDGEALRKAVVLDQREPPAGETARGHTWQSLGVYTVHSGTLAVELDAAHARCHPSDGVGASTNVDAVRIVARPEGRSP